MHSNRPVHLNLFKIKLPAVGWVSILHRASGAYLALLTPLLIYAFGQSIQNQAGFEHVLGLLNHWMVQLLIAPMIWLLIHHLFAGIRFLLLDLGIGVNRQNAIQSSWWVILVSLGLALVVNISLWGWL